LKYYPEWIPEYSKWEKRYDRLCEYVESIYRIMKEMDAREYNDWAGKQNPPLPQALHLWLRGLKATKADDVQSSFALFPITRLVFLLEILENEGFIAKD